MRTALPHFLVLCLGLVTAFPLAAQQPCDRGIFRQGTFPIVPPKFRNLPVVIADQPSTSYPAEYGIDASEYVLVRASDQPGEFAVSSAFGAVSLRGTEGNLIIRQPSNNQPPYPTAADFRIYVEPVCTTDYVPYNDPNGISVTRTDGPTPQYTVVGQGLNGSGGDSVVFYDAYFRHSTYRPPGNTFYEDPLADAARGPEIDAWKRDRNQAVNFNELNSVHRSTYLTILPNSPTDTMMRVTIRNIERNTPTYSSQSFVGGFGLSLIEYNPDGRTYTVIDADFSSNGVTLNNDRFDLSVNLRARQRQDTRLELAVWRVASVDNFRFFERGVLPYPGNIAEYDIRVYQRQPPPPGPPHDACADARPITYHPVAHCPATDTIETYFNRPSDPDGEYCEIIGDVFLSFTAASTVKKLFLGNADPTVDAEIYYRLYQGGCGGPALAECGFVEDGRDTVLLTGLTVGTEYRLLIANLAAQSPGAASDVVYCLFGAPVNCHPPTFTYDSVSCAGNRFAYIHFTIDDLGGHDTVTLVNTYDDGAVLGKFSGSGPQRALVPNFDFYAVQLIGTPGVCESEESEQIDAQLNCNGAADVCATAYALPLNFGLDGPTGIRTTFRGYAPSPAPVDVLCQQTATGPDVWFSVTNTSGETANITLALNDFGRGTEHSLRMDTYRGDCGALGNVFPYSCGPARWEVVPNVAAGETIYLRVVLENDRFPTINSEIQMVAYLLPEPDNADCATATELTPSPTPFCQESVTGSLLGAPRGTVYYRFTATSASHRLSVDRLLPGCPGRA